MIVKSLWFFALIMNFFTGILWTWIPSMRPDGMPIGEVHIYTLVAFIGCAIYYRIDQSYAPKN